VNTLVSEIERLEHEAMALRWPWRALALRRLRRFRTRFPEDALWHAVRGASNYRSGVAGSIPALHPLGSGTPGGWPALTVERRGGSQSDQSREMGTRLSVASA